MPKLKLGNWIIIGLVVTNIIIYLFFQWTIVEPELDIFRYLAELFASTAMILMACGIVLSTRLRWLESYFGGLDKMYVTHRTVGGSALFLLIGHVVLMPEGLSDIIPRRLGNVAFLSILVIVVITVAPRIPYLNRLPQMGYHRWRLLHRFLGVAFILAVIHYMTVLKLVFQSIPSFYLLAIALTAVVAWVYKIAIGQRQKLLPHTVANIRQLGTVCEVTLQPQGDRVSHAAGQFLFVHFPGDPVLSEPHPFTISSGANEPNLRLSIRGSGDWTKYMSENIKPGMEAQVDGGYGRFDYKTGGPEQIWIAGGIGVTPFLSWVRSAGDRLGTKVDFFYSVRKEADALFWDEFEAAGGRLDDFRAHVQYSSTDGRLSPKIVTEKVEGDIRNKHIYLCGPLKLTESFGEAFRKMGVPADQIHFEEFNFR